MTNKAKYQACAVKMINMVINYADKSYDGFIHVSIKNYLRDKYLIIILLYSFLKLVFEWH